MDWVMKMVGLQFIPAQSTFRSIILLFHGATAI
jgi:hypothetical protein